MHEWQRDKLIVALDVPNVEKAKHLVTTLGDGVSFYKVGLELFLVGGFSLVQWLTARGKQVFVDLKLFDIPRTVAAATRAIASHRASFFTVHPDPGSIKAAVLHKQKSKLLVVSLLTSISSDHAEKKVMQVADLAFGLGADGLIASAGEAKLIKAKYPNKLVVTPGVRLSGDALSKDDQKRVATPYDALVQGSDFLVVGRPILQHSNPCTALQAVHRSMQGG